MAEGYGFMYQPQLRNLIFYFI